MLYSYVTVNTAGTLPVQAVSGTTSITLTADVKQNDPSEAIAANPTGTVYFLWYTTPDGTPGVIGTASNFSVVTPNLDSQVSGTFTLTQPFGNGDADSFGDFLIVAVYGGDSNFPDESSYPSQEGLPTTRIDSQDRYVPVDFGPATSSSATLSVTAQPTATAAGDKITPPVQVSVLDANGSVDTTSTAAVTVALASTSTGTGTLSGTTTVAAVNGVASFTDLSIDKAGQYALTFADAAGNTATSDPFQVSTEHLAFAAPPTTAAAGKVIAPAVTVGAYDAAGNPDPTATGSVTLALASASRLGTSPGTLGGTATEPLVDGVATFSDLTVSADGTYVLNATDSDATVPGAASGKFRIGTSDLTVEITTKLLSKEKGGSLAKGAMPGDRVLYSVLVTPHQTIQTANVVLTLPAGFTPAGITAGGVFAGNTITWTANTRLYDFDLTVPDAATLAGLKQIATSVDDAVAYTDGSTDEATATNVVKLGASDDHLKFVKQPPTEADALAAVPVTVDLVDSHGRIDTSESAAGVQLSLQTVTGGAGAKLVGTTTATFVGGVATFPATAAPAVSGVGTFRLLADETGTDTLAAQGTTAVFKVTGYQYKITDTQRDGQFLDDRIAAVNDDLDPGGDGFTGTNFLVEVRDAKGKPLANSPLLPPVQISLAAVSGTGTLVGPTVVAQGNYQHTDYRVPVAVSTAGTYRFTLAPVDTPGVEIPAAVITPLTTEPIKVFDPKLEGRTYGNVATTPANVPFPLFAGLVFPTGKYDAPLVTTASVGVLLTLTAVSGDGQFSGGTSFPLLPPDRANRDTLASGENIMIDAPGIYRVTFTEEITPGGLPFDPANATPVSGRAPAMTTIRIAPDHLVFMPQPPRTLVAGQPFSVTVAAVDTKGRVITTFTDQPDQNGLVLEVSISVYTSRTGKTADFAAVPAQTFSDGLVTFDNLTIAAGPLVRLHATLIVYNTFQGFVNDSHSPDAVSLFDRVVSG